MSARTVFATFLVALVPLGLLAAAVASSYFAYLVESAAVSAAASVLGLLWGALAIAAVVAAFMAAQQDRDARRLPWRLELRATTRRGLAEGVARMCGGPEPAADVVVTVEGPGEPPVRERYGAPAVRDEPHEPTT